LENGKNSVLTLIITNGSAGKKMRGREFQRGEKIQGKKHGSRKWMGDFFFLVGLLPFHGNIIDFFFF